LRLLAWGFFATLSLILMIQLRGLDEPLQLTDTPRGIVGYELSWSAARAQRTVTAWRQNDVIDAAKVSLGVDFAFLLAYPLLFFTSVRLLVREPRTGLLDGLGFQLGRAVLLCIPLDASENLLLWRMLDHGASESLAHLATLCATIKFLLVIVTALWCVAALVRRLATLTMSRTS
jgi:hypothetical protein